MAHLKKTITINPKKVSRFVLTAHRGLTLDAVFLLITFAGTGIQPFFCAALTPNHPID